MEFSKVLFEIAGYPVTGIEIAAAAGALALVLLIVIAVSIWRSGAARHHEVIEARRRTAELENRLAELSGQMLNFAETTAARESQIARNLDDRLDKVSERLGKGLTQSSERTTQSLRHLYERLAVIDTAQQKITDLSSQMLSLKEILSNKQARGAYGQARMESIVRDGLNASAYSFQATLSNKSRPDCLIRLPESDLHIVIDAKFPLEAFNALKTARGDTAIRAAERRLRSDVMQHVNDISGKYLINGETHEPAIMFVPAESIYADLHEHFEDIIQKAHRKRVIIASPNILMLLVQTMQAIFKDARMREQASLIQKEVVFLLEDVGRLKERLDKLQSHFNLANKDIDDLVISSGKITRRGEKIEQMDLSEDDQDAAIGDAAEKPKLVASRTGAARS